MKEENKAFIIMGVARGGTSMTAGIVSTMGVSIATDTPTKHQLKFNPRGMYEHADFWCLSNPVSEKENEEKAKRIFEKHSKGCKLWGFKNLGHDKIGGYLHLIKNPHIILVTRSLADNAMSYQAFTGENGIDISMRMALKRVSESAFNIHNLVLKHDNIPLCVTTYESIRNNTMNEAKKIAAFIGIEIDEKIEKRITDFVSPNLHTWFEQDSNKAKYKDQ